MNKLKNSGEWKDGGNKINKCANDYRKVGLEVKYK